jgi:hypothetical protein
MIEVPIAVALAIAYGSTSRTFGADEGAVRGALEAMTGLRVPPVGPVMASMMRLCSEHVERHLPALAGLGAPPDFGDTADYAYLARAVSLYGTTISLQPLPAAEHPAPQLSGYTAAEGGGFDD